ncbi:hypothetical protein [Alteromonas mediterranea]|nr:hypothetical protein [Alteromonas mediterranea]
MPTPLACIMLMSQTETDRQVLTSLSQTRATIPPNLGEATGPVIALVDFLVNLPTTLEAFVNSAMTRYCGAPMNGALPSALPGLSGFHMSELSNPAFRWLLILDDRYKRAQSQGISGKAALAHVVETVACPTD